MPIMPHGLAFDQGVYPTEGGVRYFLTTLGRNSEAGGETVTVEQGETLIQVAVQKLNLLLVQAVGVLRQASVLSSHSLGTSPAVSGWSDP